MWDRLRTELPPCHVPDEVYAIAEVYVYRMAATAPPYARPEIFRGQHCTQGAASGAVLAFYGSKWPICCGDGSSPTLRPGLSRWRGMLELSAFAATRRATPGGRGRPQAGPAGRRA
jgi:hypothetical protein